MLCNCFLNRLLAISFLSLSSYAGALVDTQADAKAKEKEQIMKYDQVEPTDSLVIPLDESEVEDEALIERLEGKDVFPLKTPLPKK